MSLRYDESEYVFLAENPMVGRARPEFAHAGLRSWRVQGFRNYLIFYRIGNDRLQIWRVLHGSRDLQEVMK